MSGRLRLLVVDDELPNLRTFQRVYRKQYDIEIAQSGVDGLAILGEREFDVVLSDYGMPGMTGAEFVSRAKAVQQVAVVMVTGYMNHPEVVALEQAGAVFAVVGKPWDRDAICQVIAGASEHTSAIRRKE